MDGWFRRDYYSVVELAGTGLFAYLLEACGFRPEARKKHSPTPYIVEEVTGTVVWYIVPGTVSYIVGRVVSYIVRRVVWTAILREVGGSPWSLVPEAMRRATDRVAGHAACRAIGQTAGQMAMFVATRAVLSVVPQAVRTVVRVAP